MSFLIVEIIYRIGNRLSWIGINIIFWIGLSGYRIVKRLS